MPAKLARAARLTVGLALVIGSLALSGCVVTVRDYHHHDYYHDRDYD
jgi:hypothetical protein